MIHGRNRAGKRALREDAVRANSDGGTDGLRMDKPTTEPAKTGSIDYEAFGRNLARMIEEGGKRRMR